jgi:hypothetical protein
VSNGDEKICEIVRGILTHNGVLEQEIDIQYATKFVVKSGVPRAGIVVYNTGRIHVEGAESELKTWCLDVKKSIEEGASAPGILLPTEIEKLPQTLQQRVPACDGVILWFFQEALRCYKGGSPAGAAFLLGAASEKAILNLIEAYASSIADEENKQKFLQRVNNRMISVKYDEFKRSYKSASPKPKDPVLAQDLEQILDGAFNFYRHTRNQVGHPQVIPDLDRGVILANLGQFIVYVERIYALIEFFNSNAIQV